MDFKMDEMHQDLLDMYREFAQNTVKPLAAEIDRDERFPEETAEDYFIRKLRRLREITERDRVMLVIDSI